MEEEDGGAQTEERRVEHNTTTAQHSTAQHDTTKHNRAQRGKTRLAQHERHIPREQLARLGAAVRELEPGSGGGPLTDDEVENLEKDEVD